MRKDKAEERVIMQRLKTEFEANQEQLDVAASFWKQVATNMGELESLMGPR